MRTGLRAPIVERRDLYQLFRQANLQTRSCQCRAKTARQLK
ncbi:Uncharacterized protein ALO41_05042 [Pseudomonas amygdali pv. ulmi]|uniref:Uncharacterized protein n=1 Tax=Pseudomonas amygdali pv. ulmi TaxID=251720 RepID=A0A0Q0G9S7_PSEA0|nr:Uncharacterized protein ALO41_05042 [Pseudomonas amygdali pv. ulmi]RMR16956.1 hypothetical protein ALP90_04797 [Pseudomonas amygdali pv. ulmi]